MTLLLTSKSLTLTSPYLLKLAIDSITESNLYNSGFYLGGFFFVKVLSFITN